MPLTDEFFTALREVRPLSEALIAALKARAEKAPAEVRREIEESLHAAGVPMPAFLHSLYQELASADANRRIECLAEHAASLDINEFLSILLVRSF